MRAPIHQLRQELSSLMMALITFACWKYCLEGFPNLSMTRFRFLIWRLSSVVSSILILLDRIFYLFHISLAGPEENLQVCEDKYSSWSNSRGWTALLCMCSFEPRGGSSSPYWTSFIVGHILFKRNTYNRFWRRRNFWGISFFQGFCPPSPPVMVLDISYVFLLSLLPQLPFLCGLPFLERSAPQTAHLIVGRSGKHLFLTDNDEGKPPLLVQMVNDSNDVKFMLVLT